MKTSNVTPRFASPHDLDGRLPLRQAIPLGLQHVLAMFVGNLSPLLILMAVCGITVDAGYEALRVSLLQNAMLVAGLVTLLQLYPIGPIGARLPIVMGTSSGFIGVNKAIAVSMMAGIAAGTISTNVEAGIYAYGAVMGASLIGGVWEMVQGFLIKPLRRFFPPVVTGVVVTAIGLSLIPVGIGFFGGGNASGDYGALWNLFLGLVTLIVILIFKHACTGFLSVASILLGIIAGYLVSFLMGLVLPHTTVIDGKEVVCGYITNWAQVKDAAWFAIPQWMPVKFQFNIGAIVPMLIMFVVTAVETVGDTAGVVQGGLDREATDKELSGGVICDGLGSTFAALFGVLPNTSFSQNVGLVAMTKVVNRMALASGAVFLILCGLIPKLGALISIMPQAVLGGAAVMMFSSIVVSGIQLITKEKMTPRQLTIVSVALGVGYGMGANSGILAQAPQAFQLICGESGIVPAAFVAILLNVLLPKNDMAE